MLNYSEDVKVDAGIEAQELADRLRPVLLKLNRELRRETQALGVTAGQVALLITIKKTPGIGASELAALERVSPAAISGAIDRLEKAGLLRRVQGTEDRRRQDLIITPEGERLLRSVRSRRTAWLAERLERLSVSEREAVDAAIGPLERLLEAGE